MGDTMSKLTGPREYDENRDDDVEAVAACLLNLGGYQRSTTEDAKSQNPPLDPEQLNKKETRPVNEENSTSSPSQSLSTQPPDKQKLEREESKNAVPDEIFVLNNSKAHTCPMDPNKNKTIDPPPQDQQNRKDFTKENGSARKSGGTGADTNNDEVSGNKNSQDTPVDPKDFKGPDKIVSPPQDQQNPEDFTKEDGSARKSGGTGADTNNDAVSGNKNSQDPPVDPKDSKDPDKGDPPDHDKDELDKTNTENLLAKLKKRSRKWEAMDEVMFTFPFANWSEKTTKDMAVIASQLETPLLNKTFTGHPKSEVPILPFKVYVEYRTLQRARKSYSRSKTVTSTQRYANNEMMDLFSLWINRNSGMTKEFASLPNHFYSDFFSNNNKEDKNELRSRLDIHFRHQRDSVPIMSDLLDIDCICIPIFKKLDHYSCVFVVNISSVGCTNLQERGSRVPCILHLDSLSIHQTEDIGKDIRAILNLFSEENDTYDEHNLPIYEIKGKSNEIIDWRRPTIFFQPCLILFHTAFLLL